MTVTVVMVTTTTMMIAMIMVVAMKATVGSSDFWVLTIPRIPSHETTETREKAENKVSGDDSELLKEHSHTLEQHEQELRRHSTEIHTLRQRLDTNQGGCRTGT